MQKVPPIVDKYGRVMGKLRVSLTDRCNMKCIYCMPENTKWVNKNEILTLEEIYKIVEIFVTEFGITEVRLTGGEPLLRKGIVELVACLSKLKTGNLKRISLSTNGLLLEKYIEPLKISGLDDLNISLDSLKPEVFKYITKGGDLKTVLNGIAISQRLGFPVKINTVLIKGINDEEIETLIQWAKNNKVEIRFIEFMPLGGIEWSPKKVLYLDEILNILRKNHVITPLDSKNAEPAKKFLLDKNLIIGIIPTISQPFCMLCNRIRISSDGKILNCLFANYGYDIKGPLRKGNIKEVKEIIKIAWQNKLEGFIALKDKFTNPLPMHAIGG